MTVHGHVIINRRLLFLFSILLTVILLKDLIKDASFFPYITLDSLVIVPCWMRLLSLMLERLVDFVDAQLDSLGVSDLRSTTCFKHIWVVVQHKFELIALELLDRLVDKATAFYEHLETGV